MPKTYYKIEESKLLKLITDHLKFEALKAGGVNNWSNYSNALNEELKDADETSYKEYAYHELENCIHQEPKYFKIDEVELRHLLTDSYRVHAIFHELPQSEQKDIYDKYGGESQFWRDSKNELKDYQEIKF